MPFIKDPKIGNVESDTNSHNSDNGSDKNNKQKTFIKNSNLENSNNSNEISNNQGVFKDCKAEKIENNYYYEKRAHEDSKNEQKVRIVELKSKLATRIYEIHDTYTDCENCIEKYKVEMTSMLKNLTKQTELRKKTFDGLLPEEGQKYLIGNPPAMIGKAGDVEVTIINYQKKYLDNYKFMKPGYFNPCKEHSKLSREWYLIEEKIKDYDQILKK